MPGESEWKTRKKRIDPKLDAAGWRLRGGAAHRTEEEETANGPADYALWLDDGIVGVVEAKKLTVGPQNVLTQAERYARGIDGGSFNFGGLRCPFLYSTNGEVIWFHDVRHPLNRSRRVAGFHTSTALREALDRDFDGATQKLLGMVNDRNWLRPYQRDANTAVEKAIAERKRNLLVAMATGTGKTFTLVNQIYRLMKSGVTKRVLFLVDRRALAAQAVRAFSTFEAEPGQKFDHIYEVYSSKFQTDDFGDEEKFDPKIMPQRYLTDPQPGHAFVYVATIQRMAINILGRQAIFGTGDETADEDADKLDIPIHAFDVIVADECHRGYTSQEVSTWRSTLDHFDAIKVGLTATPASHTTAYFTNKVFDYPYERAVREGHLVDYDVVNVRSNVRMHGVFLKEGENVEVVDPETGLSKMDQLEDERPYDATELERTVTSPESNRKVVEEVKKYADEHEKRHGRFPKTLFFAVNDLPHTSHADQLVDVARDVFGKGDSFVEKITGRVDRPLQKIREFRNRPNPGVAVTVDLLTTGVDIPDLEYIVFMRPVRSRILFEQMVGRGTRKGERFTDKDHFTVFDCFDGTLLAYFKNSTGITAEEPTPPTRTIEDIVKSIWDSFAGEDRIFGLEALAADRLFVHLAGGVVPSIDTTYRDLARFDDQAIADLERLMAREGLRTLRGRKFARVHLDVDTTVEPLFGCQQGAVPGPNPHYHGRPSYHPILGRVAETDAIVGALLRPGDTGLGDDETLLVKTWMARLRAAVGPDTILCTRIDAAGDCTGLMQGIATEKAYFVIKAKRDQKLLDAVALHSKWTTVDVDAEGKPLTQVAQIDFSRDVWTEAGLDVRVVAMRTRGDRSGKQIFLWQDLDFTTQVFLTNDRYIAAEDLAFEYNARAGIEPVIGELKSAWGLGKVPSHIFEANHAAMLIKLLAYNLMRRFAVASCPPELHGWRASWLRRALIWTPGRLVRSGRQWSLRLPPSSMLARNLN